MGPQFGSYVLEPGDVVHARFADNTDVHLLMIEKRKFISLTVTFSNPTVLPRPNDFFLITIWKAL